LKGINIFLIIFVVLMMFFTVITLKNANNKNSKGLFGYKMFIVLSDSMKPKFQGGDIVITKSIDPKKLKKGDIITFYSSDPNSYIVTHQIVEVTTVNDQLAFVTKGLNVEKNDDYPAYASNVLGKFSFSIPKAGYLFQFIKKPVGYILLIFIPFLILVGLNGYQLVKAYKLYRKEKMSELEKERKKNQELYEELQRLRAQLDDNNYEKS
ncbi:MAG TPA: signal peptidase I, partial [Haloplasmataceae bacterium]